jgi:phage gp45-like
MKFSLSQATLKTYTMNILKGHILETKEGGRFAKIQGMRGEIFDDVLLVYPYGFNSNIGTGDSTLALVFYGTGSSTNAFAIPYDILSQSTSLEQNEVSLGDFKDGNKITFKKDGSILIESGSTNITILKDGNVTVTSPLVNFSADVNVAGVYKVDGTQVVSNQGAAVPDATGGITVDAEARAAINTLLLRLRAHGLIAV